MFLFRYVFISIFFFNYSIFLNVFSYFNLIS